MPAVREPPTAAGGSSPSCIAAALGAFAAASIAGLGPLGDELREVTLPLRHEDIIRQQAADKDLDPALIAAVIFEESRFRDQTSHAGARGLMQITPATARFIARDSGGTAFVEGDLATPQVNISYGAYYMRYLLRRYDGDATLAVAAYNAGETNVNKWIEQAGGGSPSTRRRTCRSRRRATTCGTSSRSASSTGTTTATSWGSEVARRSGRRGFLRSWPARRDRAPAAGH